MPYIEKLQQCALVIVIVTTSVKEHDGYFGYASLTHLQISLRTYLKTLKNVTAKPEH